jgi:transposase
VKLVPAQYVKPFVKRRKNDAMDAAAIFEAAMRPTMRFVAIKSEEKHADCMLFLARDLLVRQRSQLAHAMRGHFADPLAQRGSGSVRR